MIRQHIEDIVEHLELNRVESAFGVLCTCVLREHRQDPWAPFSPQEVRDVLQEYVKSGRLLVLYPPDVRPERAPMVFTYYIKAPPKA